MITADPGRRAQAWKTEERCAERAAPEDRDLVLDFARRLRRHAGPPRAGLAVEALTTDARAFRFVAREIPPAIQLYRGLPGITSRRGTHRVGGGGHGRETASRGNDLVEPTPRSPFIFESLKNYFASGAPGVRVIHQIFTVRGRGRPVWVGGPRTTAPRLYCAFQIERVGTASAPPHRAEVFYVLKSFFTAFDDYRTMNARPRPSRALRDRTEGARRVGRAGLPGLDGRRELHLPGSVRYRIGSDGKPDRVPESALGAFTDEAILQVVFPGLPRRSRAAAPERRGPAGLDIESRTTPPPCTTGTLDTWWCAVGPRASRGRRSSRPAGQVAFTQKAADIPLLRQNTTGSSARRAMPNSHLYRETRALFNRFPKRELFTPRAQP